MPIEDISERVLEKLTPDSLERRLLATLGSSKGMELPELAKRLGVEVDEAQACVRLFLLEGLVVKRLQSRKVLWLITTEGREAVRLSKQ